MKALFIFALTSLSLMSGPSFAQDSEVDREPAAADQAPTVEERARVKKRLYPGGRDEQPLQVQEQIAVATGGRTGTTDEPAEPDDHD